MVHCVVRGCTNESYEACLISFHTFPKDEALKQRWLTALGKVSVMKNAKICHHHFSGDDFEYDTALRRKLKSNVVPSIFLNEQVATGELRFVGRRRSACVKSVQLASGKSGSNEIYKDKEIHLEHGYTKKRHFDHSYSKPDGPSTSTDFPIPSTSQTRSGDHDNEYSYGIDLNKGDVQDDCINVPDDDCQDVEIDISDNDCQLLFDDDCQDDEINIPYDDCQPLFDDDCQVVYDDGQVVEGGDDGQAVVDDDDLSFYLNLPKKSDEDKESVEKEILPEPEDGLHEGFVCNNCSGVIEGYRYTCVQCSDFDLCSACEAKGAHFLHYVLRIPSPRSFAEIQSVVDMIRQQLRLGLDTLVPCELHEDTDLIIKDEVKEEGGMDPLSIDALPTATTPGDMTMHTDTVVGDTEAFGIDAAILTHENAKTIYYSEIDNVYSQRTSIDNFSASSLYTASTEQALGGSTVLTVVTRLDPTDSTRVYNATDSTIIYNPTDSTIIYNPTDSTIIYNATDSTRVYNPTDSTIAYNATDSTVVHNPMDSTIVYSPTDSTTVYNPMDSTRGYNPMDSSRFYNPMAKRKYDDVPTQSVDVLPESAKKPRVVLTPLPVELLQNRGARLTISGPSTPTTTQCNPGVTNQAMFRVGRHRPLRTDRSDDRDEAS